MKLKTFQSPENGLYDIDLGVLGVCTWSAKYWMNGVQVIVESATAINPFGGGEIDITDFVKQDYDCKNWIALYDRRESEKDLLPDEDRPFEEFLDRERTGA